MSRQYNTGAAESRTPTSHCLPTTGSRTIRFDRGSAQGIGEGGVVGLARSRRCASDRMRPSGGFHLIGRIQPVREDSTRSEGVESSRSGVTPHRPQAPSRSRPPMTPRRCWRCPTGVYRHPAGQLCTSLGALHQLGSITLAPNWCNTPLSGVTPLSNKAHRRAVTRHSIEETLGPSARPHIERRRCASTPARHRGARTLTPEMRTLTL